jgi:hypothetical protein
MPDGKSGNQYQYFTPVGELIPETKCHYKQDMINTLEVSDMLKPDLEIEAEIIHVLDVKLIMTFGANKPPC